MARRVFASALVLAALVLVLLPATVLSAPNQVTSGAPLNDSLTPQERSNLKALTIQKEIALGIRSAGDMQIMSPNYYGLITRPVSNYMQETGYWCGPAAARQALSFHKAFSGSGVALPSQPTLAVQIHTNNPNGSETWRIADALNLYDGTFGPVFYIASDIEDTPNPTETFWNRIGAMLSQVSEPTTPITLNATKWIPRYSGQALRDYVTISGIDGRYSPKMMRDVDPNSNPLRFGIWWDKVGSTTIDGLAKACYYADTAGDNLAMAW